VDDESQYPLGSQLQDESQYPLGSQLQDESQYPLGSQLQDESQYPLGSQLQDDSMAVISGTGAHAAGGINPLNAKLNPICCLLAIGAHTILHVSRIRVKGNKFLIDSILLP